MKTNVAEYNREHKRKQRLSPAFVELERKRNIEWRSNNKESIAVNKKEYYLQNVESLKAKKKTRHIDRRKRSVDFSKELTVLVNLEAKKLVKLRNALVGGKWSIDHIIPLIGKKVSGLHVWNNLQVIPLSENHRKYNSYEEAGN